MIAVRDIAYVRYGAPDLDAMERFLVDFGLHRVLRDTHTLYMRAAGAAPFVHVTELGQSARQGIGFWAQSLRDLQQLATQTHSVVEPNREPGGGSVVRLHDPDGLKVDVLFGQTELPPLSIRPCARFNLGGARHRGNEPRVLPKGPSTVVRLGHVVIRVASFRITHAWYRDVLGLRISDSYHAGAEDNLVMAFLRCGLGSCYTDHHTIALIEQPVAGLDHMGFEVLDFDDLMIGKEHLHRRGHRHAWGVGRHLLGSQIFDYWRDPIGMKVEHWTDGDAVNDEYSPKNLPMGLPDDEDISAWGPPLTAEFFS